MDAGMDSLAAVELTNNIQTRFDLVLPQTITFDYPSIQSLAAYISDQISFANAKPRKDSLLIHSPTRVGYQIYSKH